MFDRDHSLNEEVNKRIGAIQEITESKHDATYYKEIIRLKDELEVFLKVPKGTALNNKLAILLANTKV